MESIFGFTLFRTTISGKRYPDVMSHPVFFPTTTHCSAARTGHAATYFKKYLLENMAGEWVVSEQNPLLSLFWCLKEVYNIQSEDVACLSSISSLYIPRRLELFASVTISGNITQSCVFFEGIPRSFPIQSSYFLYHAFLIYQRLSAKHCPWLTLLTKR